MRQPLNPKPNGLPQNGALMPQPKNGVLFCWKTSAPPSAGVMTGTAAKIPSSWTSLRASSMFWALSPLSSRKPRKLIFLPFTPPLSFSTLKRASAPTSTPGASNVGLPDPPDGDLVSVTPRVDPPPACGVLAPAVLTASPSAAAVATSVVNTFR